MRALSVLGTLCVGAAAISFASAAAAPAPVLTGPMAKLQYLVGSWRCTTAVAAQGEMPAHMETSKLSVGVAPRNALGFYLTSADYSGGWFMGWSGSQWFVAGADSYGGSWHEAGTGAGVMTLTGTSVMRGQSMASRDTYTRISTTKVRDRYEVLGGGRWQTGYTANCTKT